MRSPFAPVLTKTLARRTSATHLSLVSRIRPITWIGAWWVEAFARGGPWPQLVIPESAQWLGMSIQEARERREGEAQIPARLPRALEETHRHLPGASSAAERNQDQLPTMEGPTRRIVDRVFSPQPT